jgi:hypothetical protein
MYSFVNQQTNQVQKPSINQWSISSNLHCYCLNPMVSSGFPMVFPWFSHGFQAHFPRSSSIFGPGLSTWGLQEVPGKFQMRQGSIGLRGHFWFLGFWPGDPSWYVMICLYFKLIIHSNCIYDIYIYHNCCILILIIHIISNIIFYNTYMIIHVWPWDGMGFTTMLHRPRMNCLFLHCETEHLGYLLSFQHLSPRKMKMFELVEKSNWSQQPEIARHGLETSFSSSR